MSDIMRSTLPAEFFDVTSPKLLLAPEPQYLHAKLWKMALGVALDLDAAGLDFGNSGAPYQSDAEAGRLMLADGLYSESIVVIPEIGKGPGHVVRLNRPSFTNSTYTEAAREVPAGTTISTTSINVGSDQVPLALKRYAGPYCNTAAGVRPYGVDRFDSSVALHRVAQVAGLHMRRDFDRTVDTFVRAMFDGAPAANIVRPVGMSSDDSVLAAGDYPFSFSLIPHCERVLDAANVPAFANGRRVMILHPMQCQQLANDDQFNKQSVFERDFNPLFAGSYWRSCGNFDIFKSTTLQTASNTTSQSVYYAQAFGPGAVGSGVGDMPRVAQHSSDNYGETAYLIWLLYAAFGVLDNRFLARITTG